MLQRSRRASREAVSPTAARLLADLQVRDLAIQEPEVDEVIRSLFSWRLRNPESTPKQQPVPEPESEPEGVNG